ncbi:hypothetical protein RJ641_001515 [Dillenia turbinata]|uniref:Uncharacterized protein n=1 Tax=Dillenia turbinata TaxID=194707 RepID=A0AAN8ZBB5_9MAGN
MLHRQGILPTTTLAPLARSRQTAKAYMLYNKAFKAYAWLEPGRSNSPLPIWLLCLGHDAVTQNATQELCGTITYMISPLLSPKISYSSLNGNATKSLNGSQRAPWPSSWVTGPNNDNCF